MFCVQYFIRLLYLSQHMSNNLRESIFSSRSGQIATLFFSAYTLAWAIIEPLNLDWVNSHKTIWRIILLSFAAIVTIVLSIRLVRKQLDKIDADGSGRTLQNSYSSKGNPKMTVQKYGHIGHVVNIKGNYSDDESDWLIKSSAQKAKKMELIFDSHGKFDFYLRVAMLSSNDSKVSTVRWIRFDSLIATPDQYILDTPELGVPYTSKPFKGFNKSEIDISDAVKKSYGQDGWVYDKIMIFRIRCNVASIKSVAFMK